MSIEAQTLDILTSAQISDLFAIHERGTAIGWYSLGSLLGPSIGALME